jgi:hypothetical protein
VLTSASAEDGTALAYVDDVAAPGDGVRVRVGADTPAMLVAQPFARRALAAEAPAAAGVAAATAALAAAALSEPAPAASDGGAKARASCARALRLTPQRCRRMLQQEPRCKRHGSQQRDQKAESSECWRQQQQGSEQERADGEPLNAVRLWATSARRARSSRLTQGSRAIQLAPKVADACKVQRKPCTRGHALGSKRQHRQ